jgi:cysteine/serine-rich nuclear protein
MPKRKFDEVGDKVELDAADCGSPELETPESTSETFDDSAAEDSNSSTHTNSSTDVPTKETGESFTSVRKRKQKRNVKFQDVTVFYFPRKQGFVCVPSQGGSTLGMGEDHVISENYTISEYTKLQKRIHREILMEQQQQGKLVHSPLLKTQAQDDSQQSESSDSEEDLNVDDYYFLQPVPTRQRRLMLRQSGIKKIDTVEKEDCKDIRSSRELCGCDCRVYCDPDTCQCAQAGIKCQVDRLSFPCGCSKDGCGNSTGRVEFNPIRVRTHFIHTVMRLEMERKREAERQQLKEQLGHVSDDDEKLVQEENPDGKTKEELNKLKYNSNEGGSCRDCQKSEMADLIMQHTEFATSCSTDSESLTTGGVECGESSELASSKVNEAMAGQAQHMMFNDSDEEYAAETGPSMYTFTKETESSYSESSEDCSGEDNGASRHPTHNFQNYPNLSAYPNNKANQDPNYCMPPRGNFESSTAQAESKYMELASSSLQSYKLEPISEILNPIRFSTYNSTGNQSWANCSDSSYCTYPSPPDEPTTHQAGSYGEEQSQQNYMFNHSNRGASPATSAMSCMMPSIPGAQSQFDNAAPYNAARDGNKNYHQLTNGGGRPHKQNSTSQNGEIDEKKEYADLDSAKIPKMSNGKVTESNETNKYEDLSNATSKMATENKYHDLSNATSSVSRGDTSPSYTSTNGHTLESTDIYGLPERPSVVAVANPASPPTNMETDSKQVNSDYNSRCQATNGNQGEDQTTNFGEIIKESMVETVSA